MSWVLLLSSFLLPSPPGRLAAQEAAPETWLHHPGEVFELDHPPGLTVAENGNGRVFFLVLRQPGTDPSAQPTLRLMVPETGEIIEIDDWLPEVVDDLITREKALGLDLAQRTETTVKVFSAEQPGLRMEFQGAGGAAASFLVCAFLSCQHAVAAVAPIASQEDLRVVQQILASLKGNEWGPATGIPRSIGGVQCRFPVLANVSESHTPGQQDEDDLIGALPYCHLDLKVHHAADAVAAGAQLQSAFQRQPEGLRALALDQGMEVEALQDITRWVGQGVALGELLRMRPADRDPIELQQYLMRAGDKLLDLSVSYPPAARDEAGSAVQAVLDSLDPQTIDSWREEEYLGDGFYLDLNECLPLTISDLPDGKRFEIQLDAFGDSPSNRLWFDWHRQGSAPFSAREMLDRSAAERLPMWALGTPRKVVADLLGNGEIGFCASVRQGDERGRICQFVFHFGEGWLAAGMVCPEVEGQADFVLLRRLLARIQDLRHSDPLRYHDAELALIVDPGLWTLRSLHVGHGRVLELTSGGAELSLRMHSVTDTPASSAASDTWEDRALDAIEPILEAADQAEDQGIRLGSVSVRLFARGQGMAVSYLSPAEEGGQVAHSILAAEAPQGWLEIRCDAPAEDLEARERAAALLDSLEIAGAPDSASRVVEVGEFSLPLPDGFESQRSEGAEGGLLVYSPYEQSAILIVQLVPLAQVDTDDSSIMDLFLDSAREQTAQATEETESESPLIFVGGSAHSGERLVRTLPQDGGVRIFDAYAFRDSRYQYRVLINGGREAICDGASSLRRILAGIITP